MTTTTTRLGVRFEFYSRAIPGKQDETLVGAVLREDLLAAAAPRVGESFPPAALGDAALLLVRRRVVTSVEHSVKTPAAVDGGAEPLVTAVIAVTMAEPSAGEAALAYAAEIAPRMKADGWQVHQFVVES